MADRISSDHSSVESVRAHVARRGGTRRPVVDLAEESAGRIGEDVVRLVIDDREFHAPVSDETFLGAFDNPRLARDRQGPNRLSEWIEDRGVDVGRAVVVDVVVPDFRYGLRLPGDERVYDANEPPNRGLRDIADGLDGS